MKRLYIVFIFSGLIINFILNFCQFRNEKLNIKENIIINVLEIIGLILGSKLLDIIVNYKYYIYYDILQSIYIGYMFYGGMILAIALIFLYCTLKNINIINVFEIVLPNMLILYACWKIGCFSNNCCVGINNFPIQIIESIICIILYYIIRISKIRKKISIICIIFGITRIVTFLLRNKISFNNLIINEVISICILLIGIKTTINKERRVI